MRTIQDWLDIKGLPTIPPSKGWRTQFRLGAEEHSNQAYSLGLVDKLGRSRRLEIGGNPATRKSDFR